jgi:hypothetical protein
LKIATFDINDIQKVEQAFDLARQDNAGRCASSAAKGGAASLSAAGAEKPVYEAVWEGERSWNARGNLSRNRSPVLTLTYIYLPNGGS